MVARRFLELGPSGAAEVDDERVCISSLDERGRSTTPKNNRTEKEEKKECDTESAELIQAWDPNKLQKLSPSNAMDQAAAEATMRKARVSVRAHSEAPMVCTDF